MSTETKEAAPLPPGELLARAIEASLALSAAAIATPVLENPAAAQAYAAACGLAGRALEGAQALVAAGGAADLSGLAATAEALFKRVEGFGSGSTNG